MMMVRTIKNKGKTIPSIQSRVTSYLKSGYITKPGLISALSVSSEEECVMWHGGLKLNDLYCLIKSICPCLDEEDFQILIESVNEIYKEFYYYDLLADTNEFYCGCINFSDYQCDTKSYKKIHSLGDDDLSLIKLIINIYCKRRNKKKVTIEDLKDPELVIRGIVPSSFDFDEFMANSYYKYCRQRYSMNFCMAEPSKKYGVYFYEGQMGYVPKLHNVYFYLNWTPSTITGQ